MIKRIATLGSLLLLLLSTGKAVAQSSGTFEIGGFARYSLFDDDLGLEDKVGGGGTLGLFLMRNLALEAEVAYTKTGNENPPPETSVSSIPARARLTYHIPIGGWASAIRIGAGYVRDMYSEDADFDGNGVTGVLGLRVGLNKTFALNLDGTVDYVPSPPDETTLDDYMNFGVQGGLVLLFGNKYDKDEDGVMDNVDDCLATPVGEQVDDRGCSASQRDTDRDGVKDNADRCANTPAGEKVNQQGCSAAQLDKDLDKVPDTADKCPDTPAGQEVDENGCAASQRDVDGDGVMDDADKCLDSAPGEPVDSQGCALDTDADTVPDARDKCPGTPNGQAVDESGCPQIFQGAERSVILQGVNFPTGKTELTDASKAILVEVAHSLAASPGTRVEVAGYTDNTGSRKANLRVSQQRAVAVEKFLVENGVSPAQITAHGYGPDNPVAENKTAAGRAQNRRVELRRLD